MQIRIRLFAGLADRLGHNYAIIEIQSDSITVAELKQELKLQYPAIAEHVDSSFMAVNQAYALPDDSITLQDELALIPPVSGGQPAAEPKQPNQPARELFQLVHEPIDLSAATAPVLADAHGATLSFIGTTREWTAGKRTILLEYEAYEPMALKTMEQIGAEIGQQWPGTQLAITHRLGRVPVGETSVVIAVSAPHRADCYEASRYAIERLKQIVPIWKKEIWADGSEWKGHQLGPWNPLDASQEQT